MVSVHADPAPAVFAIGLGCAVCCVGDPALIGVHARHGAMHVLATGTYGFAGSFTSVSTAGYADRDLCVAAAWEILAQPVTAFNHAGKL